MRVAQSSRNAFGAGGFGVKGYLVGLYGRLGARLSAILLAGRGSWIMGSDCGLEIFDGDLRREAKLPVSQGFMPHVIELLPVG